MDKGKGDKKGDFGGMKQGASGGKTAGSPPPGMKAGGGKEAVATGKKVDKT